MILHLCDYNSWSTAGQFGSDRFLKPASKLLGASTAPPSSGSSNKGPGTIKDALNLVKSASGGTDRVSALKQAFSAQYRMTFQAARESGASELEFSDPKPEWKRKADELKQQQQKPDEDGGGKKRKTRWN